MTVKRLLSAVIVIGCLQVAVKNGAQRGHRHQYHEQHGARLFHSCYGRLMALNGQSEYIGRDRQGNEVFNYGL